MPLICYLVLTQNTIIIHNLYFHLGSCCALSRHRGSSMQRQIPVKLEVDWGRLPASHALSLIALSMPNYTSFLFCNPLKKIFTYITVFWSCPE